MDGAQTKNASATSQFASVAPNDGFICPSTPPLNTITTDDTTHNGGQTDSIFY